MQDDLSGMGFALHEEVGATTYFQTFGGVVDGDTGQVRASPTRAWNILLAFEETLSMKVDWKAMQKLLDHAVTLCILNRAGISVFRARYDYIEKGGPPGYLNKLERREVEIFIGLVPLFVGELRAWSTTASGYGVCKLELPESDVRKLGAWQDRWRFKHLDPSEWRPRERYEGQDALRDFAMARVSPVSTTAEDLYTYNNDFPEVPPEMLKPQDWSTVMIGQRRDTSGHITAKEGHALCWPDTFVVHTEIETNVIW